MDEVDLVEMKKATVMFTPSTALDYTGDNRLALCMIFIACTIEVVTEH
jgi:hypothetical protein